MRKGKTQEKVREEEDGEMRQVESSNNSTNDINNGSLDCVCEPCDCSLHSCATFGLRPFSPASKAKDLDPTDNRCSGIDSESKTDEQKMNQHQMDQSGPRQQCKCVRPERYLTKKEFMDAPDDELLHVLVTRPEIAGKPRDNIVFEGDMDLRTTFETSYEALAKLRLECWKKYQESKQGDTEGANHSCAASVGDMNKDNNQRQDQPSDTSVSFANQQAHDDACAMHRCGQQPIVAQMQIADALQADRPLTQRPQTRETSPVSPAHQSPFELSTEQPLRPMSNLENGSYIDPDLSSIIVYDSNMNRLERVGLRKRSKYRPSTSLRTGPRGMFGDEQPALQISAGLSQSNNQQANTAKPNQQAMHTGAATKSVKEAQTQTPTEEELISGEEQEQEFESDQGAVGEDNQLMMPLKNELSLSARNLHNSNQGEYLVYTGHNLPVDSKRRVLNNVNMIDHIKEQNIIASQSAQQLASTAARRRLETPTMVSHKVQRGPIVEDQTSTEIQDELREQLQLEEAEAVNEILRATSQQEQEPCASKCIDRNEQVTGEVRRNNLRRKCQNQNFDIHNNQYLSQVDNSANYGHDIPPAIPHQQHAKFMVMHPDDGLGRATTIIHSRTSPIYSNLFRESPDFILTTGKFLDEEAHRAAMDRTLGDKQQTPDVVELRSRGGIHDYNDMSSRHPYHGEGHNPDTSKQDAARRWR